MQMRVQESEGSVVGGVGGQAQDLFLNMPLLPGPRPSPPQPRWGQEGGRAGAAQRVDLCIRRVVSDKIKRFGHHRRPPGCPRCKVQQQQRAVCSSSSHTTAQIFPSAPAATRTHAPVISMRGFMAGVRQKSR